MKRCRLLACLGWIATTAWGQCCNMPASSQAAPPVAGVPGSTAFCLFEVPGDDNGRRKWINLGIVQYLELGRNDLRLYFGGGNFGGGYETRIPVSSQGDGLALIDRIRQAAATCK